MGQVRNKLFDELVELLPQIAAVIPRLLASPSGIVFVIVLVATLLVDAEGGTKLAAVTVVGVAYMVVNRDSGMTTTQPAKERDA